MKKIIPFLLLVLTFISCQNNQRPVVVQQADDYEVITSPTGQQMVVYNYNGNRMVLDYLLFQQLYNSGGYTGVYNYYRTNPSYFRSYTPSYYNNWKTSTFRGSYNRPSTNTNNGYYNNRSNSTNSFGQSRSRINRSNSFGQNTYTPPSQRTNSFGQKSNSTYKSNYGSSSSKPSFGSSSSSRKSSFGSRN
jgi:hypothetical protein